MNGKFPEKPYVHSFFGNNVGANLPGSNSLEGKSVYIDAGHGGTDFGATNGAYTESELALDISYRVAGILASQGATVYMSRTSQTEWNTPMSGRGENWEWERFPETNRSPGERARHANSLDVDFLVSIHLNSNNTGIRGWIQRDLLGQGRGTTVLFDQDANRAVAELVNHMIGRNSLLRVNDVVFDMDQGVLSEAHMTAILTESGYMGGDLEILLCAIERQIIAEGIAHGIMIYLLDDGHRTMC